MDRNTIIGFVLIGALLIGMFALNSRNNQAYLKEKKRYDDSVLAAQPKPDSTKLALDQKKADSIREVAKRLPHTFQVDSVEKLTVLENDVLKVTFTNKGAQPKEVELKKFKTYDGKPLLLQTGSFNKMDYAVKAGGSTKHTSEITFVTGEKKDNSVSYTLKDSSGTTLTHQFTLKPGEEYMLDFNISMVNAEQLIDQNAIGFTWQTESPQVEKTLAYERQQTHFSYYWKDKYNFVPVTGAGTEDFDQPVNWIAFNPQFFIMSIISPKDKFQTANVKWTVPENDSQRIISQNTALLRIPAAGNVVNVPLQLYYGPNDYKILDKYNNNMYQITTYGTGPFAFVKYINRHFLLPVWDFIRGFGISYGIVILLLTLLIRLITSPILYKSYVSGAKMKALKPEIDKLKAKFGDDKQGFSMEQMKLWKSAGVSPLGGCLPALLQIPIFMSLYYFFQSNIALRGQSFLWAKDLAAYDSIAQLPFSIPFYGDHVSLFTLTAVATSLLISIYSMSNMQDNSNPVMKYMPYIFPVLLLGVFNRLPAALTWYYTVSNTITLILQIVIQKYIINHDKILAQIEENRKKPVKQSKLQERMQAMQESNRKLQELKNKSNNNRK